MGLLASALPPLLKAIHSGASSSEPNCRLARIPKDYHLCSRLKKMTISKGVPERKAFALAILVTRKGANWGVASLIDDDCVGEYSTLQVVSVVKIGPN